MSGAALRPGGSGTQVGTGPTAVAPLTPHAPTHAPQTGSDPLATAAAGTIAVGDAAAVGTADSLARSDHHHALPAAGATSVQYFGPGTIGIAPTVARSDHTHTIPTVAPVPIAVGDTASPGATAFLGLAEHRHAVPAPPLGAPQVLGAGSTGVATTIARSDHVHPMAALAPAAHASTHAPQTGSDPLATAAAGTIAIGDAAAIGTADSLARSDHQHALQAPALPAAQVVGAGTAGVATSVARADHVHPMSAPAASLPAGYLSGLTLQQTGATTVQVAAGRARDQADLDDLVLAAAVTLDMATAGPAIQGRDQAGNFSANTMVAVYLIGGGGNPVATIASLTFPTTGPTLPGTYTRWRWLGSLSINAVANNVRNFQQSGTGLDRWHIYSQLPAADTAIIGVQGSSAGGALGVVTTSTSWRNVISGGTDVNFPMTRLVPPYPVGAGATSIYTAKGPLVRLFVTIGNDAARGFLEFAPAVGVLQAPGASPANGAGLRCYQLASNALSTFEMRVGEAQALQYRSATNVPDYCIQVAGFMDSL